MITNSDSFLVYFLDHIKSINMNFKNTIIFIVTLSTAIKATENFDDYTVFSGTAGIRMSQSEDMAECKQRCTRGAQQDALYNFFLENYPDHNLDDQTFMSLINTIIENIHSVEVHNWQHIMNGPALIDITFSVNTAFLNEMMNQYFQD